MSQEELDEWSRQEEARAVEEFEKHERAKEDEEAVEIGRKLIGDFNGFRFESQGRLYEIIVRRVES